MSSSTTITLKFKPLNIDELEREFQKAVEEGMNELSEEVEWEWRTQAAQKLDTSRDEYLKALSFTKQKDSVEVTLDGWVANMVELGHQRFNMKPGLLKGNLWRVIPLGKPKGSKGFSKVSINSPADSWIWEEIKHKGGVQIHKSVQEAVDTKHVPRIFKQIMEKIKLKDPK